MVIVIMALGTLNTFISARVSSLAQEDALGATFGLFEAAEKVAGITGPLLGGVLSQVNDMGPVIAVSLGYLVLLEIVRRKWCEVMVNMVEGKAKAD